MRTVLPPSPAHDGVAPATPRATDAQLRRAARNDRRLFLAAHPLAYAMTRIVRRRPVVRIPRVGVLVNDPSLMREVVGDGERYIKNGRRGASPLLTRALGPYSLLNTDGEEHRELRRLIGPLVTPTATRPIVDAHAAPYFEQFVEQVAGQAEGDVVQLASTASGVTVARLVGVRLAGEQLERHARELHHHAVAISHQASAISWRASESTMRSANEHIDAMTERVRGAWQDQDRATVAGVLGASGATWAQVRGVTASLMLAGIDTTAAGLGRLTALVCDSGELPTLCAEPGRIPAALDECLRFLSPIPLFTRTTTCPHRLGDSPVPQDVQLLPMLYNCLRSERVLDEPDVLRIDREQPREVRKLWFGAGPHFCPGHAISHRLLDLQLQALVQLGPTTHVVARRADRRALLPSWRVLRVGT